MVSMKEIARKLNLSRCTVSNILNNTKYSGSYKNETIEKVIKTAKDMGYIFNNVAKSLKTGVTGTIAVIVPDIANTFFIKIIKEVERLAASKDLSLIICMAEEKLERENQALRMLQSRMVDGVLISPTSYLKSLKEEYSFKLICFDRTIQSGRFPAVLFDDEQAAYDLTSKLIGKSAKKFLFLAGSRSNYTVACRLKGFKRAISDLKDDQKDIMPVYGIFDNQSAFDKVNLILNDGSFNFDGLFLSTNYFIYGVLDAIKKHDVKPKGIGGFENFNGREFLDLDIDIVEHTEKEIARLAFNSLFDLINNREVSDKVIISRGLSD